MKFIIASMLVVSVVAMASVARAGEDKSIRDCQNTIWDSSLCSSCCKKFDHVGIKGRKSFLPGADFHLCKCITKEEHEKREAKWRAQVEKEASEPTYKSIGQCSDLIGPSDACTSCCAAFDHVGVEGRHSFLPLADFHLCKCITKEEKQKRDDKWHAQWEKEQRAKGYLRKGRGE